MLPRDFTTLEQIKIASPCPAKWKSMHGDDQVRHCTHCDRKVYNLSEMTRSEAMSLLLRNEGHVCVRFYRREDGTVMTRDCGKAVRRKKGVAAWVSAAVCAVGLYRLIPSLAASGYTTGDVAAPTVTNQAKKPMPLEGGSATKRSQTEMVMGDVAERAPNSKPERSTFIDLK